VRGNCNAAPARIPGTDVLNCGIARAIIIGCLFSVSIRFESSSIPSLEFFPEA
jgi:hypothetical protein